MPTPVVADPSSTGNSAHRSISPASVRSSSAAARDLAGEVALELLVVAGDDLLDDLVVQAMLLVGDVGGEWLAVMGAVGVVLESLVGEHVGDPVQLLLLAEGKLEGGRTRCRTWPAAGRGCDGSRPAACPPC